LKRLSERLIQETTIIYKAHGLKFEPRWFAIFSYLLQHGPTSVTDLAIATGVTHPAVNQIASELSECGLIRSEADERDARRRLLILTDRAHQMEPTLKAVWRHLHAALSDINEEVQVDLVNTVLRFEQAIGKEGLLARMQKLENTLEQKTPRIIDFEPGLASDFARLNRAWIEKYFRLEPEDLRILYSPEKIIADGGYIFFAVLGEKVVGTCALLKSGAKEFEVAKMAVDEAYRGNGTGKLLLAHCIERARQLKAKALVLETNTKLTTAVHLYRRLGFLDVDDDYTSKYSRVDLVMRLPLGEG
jgi:DNA-binding MarR family transcriptional regulator/GNAT superfamily N-acetyltransferase